MRPGRRHLLLAFVGLLGLNAAVFAAHTLPRTMQERSARSRAAVVRAEVERERLRTAALRERVEAARSNASDRERFYREVVGERRSSLHTILREMEITAAELGLRLEQTIDEQKVEGAPLDRFVIRMPVTGTYRQLVSFLERLEQSGHFLTVDQIQLRDKGGEKAAKLDVVVSAYFRREDGEARGR